MARLFTGLEVVDNWNPLDEVAPPEFIPTQWNGPHVGLRLTDAWRTLNKTPGVAKPKGFQTLWPGYRFEWDDLLAIVGDENALEEMQRNANRTRFYPSSKEIAEMEISITWPMTYLKIERQVLIVNVCARVRSFGLFRLEERIQKAIDRRHYGGYAEQWMQMFWTLTDRIADGLIKDRVAIF